MPRSKTRKLCDECERANSESEEGAGERLVDQWLRQMPFAVRSGGTVTYYEHNPFGPNPLNGFTTPEDQRCDSD